MDLKIIDTDNGGDIEVFASDALMVEDFGNMIYLALFGGSEWWGNSLFLSGEPSQIFQSKTEKAMLDNAINSAGRVIIENTIKSDLEFLKQNISGLELSVETRIVAVDRMVTLIKLNDRIFRVEMTPSLAKGVSGFAIATDVFTEQFTEQFT